MKKFKITFYLEDGQNISVVNNNYDSIKELLIPIGDRNDGAFMFYSILNEKEAVSINVNKVLFFYVEEQ